MRLFTSCITDPCFHVLAVVMVLIYVAMGSGSDAQSRAVENAICQSCRREHGELEACPLPLALPHTTVRLAAQ